MISQRTDEIIEQFEELTGADHVVAMHVLLKELLKKYSLKHPTEGHSYQYWKTNNFDVDEIVSQKIIHDHILKSILRGFSLNIYVNHSNNNSIGEFRIEFPYKPIEVLNWGGLSEEEILDVYEAAVKSFGKLDTIKLPACYKTNIDVLESGRLEPE